MTASFILGVILGAGLVLAFKSVAKTLQLRRLHKMEADEQRIQLEVTRRFNEWADHNIPLGQRVPTGPSTSRPGPATW